jgi:acetyltransferase-like isoleucine patch superfamily enzyme
MLTKTYKHLAKEKVIPLIFLLFSKFFDKIRGKFVALTYGLDASYIGKGSEINGSRFIYINKGAHINKYAKIQAINYFKGEDFQPSINIGYNFFVSNHLHITSINSVSIGDNCLLGSNVYISDHNHGAYKGLNQSSPDTAPFDRPLISQGDVTIGSNVWIGNNVVIIGPVKIGNGAVIGANSVVTRNIPPKTVALGSPAKTIKNYNEDRKLWE